MFFTSYIFTLRGSIVSWHAMLQSIVSLSKTKANYMATIEVVKEVLWLKVLVDNLCISQKDFTSFVIVKVQIT